ncbi:MAG: methylmalonyl-CoA mutase [Deltaproteobacteria bacterium]|nr:MAG: methylmalonyl-CoA mutase [Deltaproteobacteria bacterium]
MFDQKKLARIEEAKKAWEEGSLKQELQTAGETRAKFSTESGIAVERTYTPLSLEDKKWDYMEDIGFPGQYPFTRGERPLMYRSIPWLMFQYAGYGSPEQTNKLFRHSLDQGATFLYLALDLPTQIGYDSDHPLSRGEVGKVGVPINSLADIETIYDGIPLENIATGTTGNAISPIYLSWMIALAEKRGIPFEKMRVQAQNEILKEYIARGTYIFPPKPGVKIACDVIEYVIKNNLSNVQPIWYCGYHMREGGANLVQELAFTLANAVTYIEGVLSRGIGIDELPQPRAGFVAGMDFFEEICKSRAFRRVWAKLMKERFGAKNERVMAISLHPGASGTAYTAQQPMNNIVRGAITALVQALSGAAVLAVKSMAESLSIPTPELMRIPLRTQQIIAEETGVTNTVDPLAGSYYVEALTSEIEERVTQLFNEVEARGGALAAIEEGFMTGEIAKSAYQQLRQVESGEKVVVGVNKYQVDEPITIQLLKVDPREEKRQIKKVKQLKKERDNSEVRRTLNELKDAAEKGDNLVPPTLAAVKTYATVGEICDVLREVYGEYVEPSL